MGAEWVSLGLAVGSLVARVASLTEESSWVAAAGTADSARTVHSILGSRSANSSGNRLPANLEKHLQNAHERYLRSMFPSGEADSEVQAVVTSVSAAISRLASPTDPDRSRTLLLSFEQPARFLEHVKAHSGDEERRRLAQHAEPAYDYLLAEISKTVWKTLRTRPETTTAALGELLRSARLSATTQKAILASMDAPNPVPAPLTTLMAASTKAREAARPKYMPAVDRRVEFGLGQGDDLPTPLVILGEGGAGKSVVAGDIVDWTNGHCLLVPCSRVPANADLSTRAAIDIALGDAASDSRDGASLTSILATLPSSMLVVIDTIDLLLTSETADNLLHLLDAVKELRPLVLTSREQEWSDLFGRDAYPEHRLGLLTAEQIREWVEVYLDAQPAVAPETRNLFQHSVRQAVRSGGRVLLGSPIRLAMACALYATEGGLPAELSVPQLYRDYWAQYVDSDRRNRRRTAEAEAQQQAALGLAARIWRSSATNFAEYVPTRGLSSSALQDLLSSGLLRTNGALLTGFFHQTFAEFAVARYLAVSATPSDAQTLQAALATNSPAHWGIARYLGWAEMDPSMAILIASALPSTVEGTRLRLRLLSTHGTPGALGAEIRQLSSTHRNLLRATFPSLSEADKSSAETVIDSALELIDESTIELSAITQTIATIIPRLEPDLRTTRLVDFCRALTRHGELGRADLARLLEATIPAADDLPFDMEALFPLYPHIGPAAQKVLIQAASRLSDIQIVELLRVALASKCPGGDGVGHLVNHAERVWNTPECREHLGWHSWQAMLDASYPQRWHAVQVRLAGRLSGDAQVRSALLGAALSSAELPDRRRYTDAASFAAHDHPAEVASYILAMSPPESRAAVGTLSTIISYLGSELTEHHAVALWEYCEALLSLDERRVLTAMTSLGTHAPALLDRTLELVIQDQEGPEPGIPRPAVDSCWDAVFAAPDQEGYGQRREKLARLVDGDRIEDRRRRTRMVGREAFDGDDSWRVVQDIVMNPGLENFAKLAVAEVVALGVDQPPSSKPLVALIDSPHGTCTRTVAHALSTHFPSDWTSEDVSVVVRRLARSVQRQEDSQVTEALLTLVAQIARHQPCAHLIDTKVVEAILEAYRQGIESNAPYAVEPAWLDQWLSTMSRIGVIRFSPQVVGARLSDLLNEVDVGAIGANASRRMGASLIGITRNSPGAWRPIVSSWRSQPVANQAAVARALIQGQIPGGREFALQRTREENCPPELARQIHTLLDT